MSSRIEGLPASRPAGDRQETVGPSPGPWSYDSGTGMVINAGGIEIADVACNVLLTVDEDANGRLMASAPDLRDACRAGFMGGIGELDGPAFLEFIAGVLDSAGEPGGWGRALRVKAAAERAALAKAGGSGE